MNATKALVTRTNREIITSSAKTVFKALNGVINVYKPAGIRTSQTVNMITSNICKGIKNFFLVLIIIIFPKIAFIDFHFIFQI